MNRNRLLLKLAGLWFLGMGILTPAGAVESLQSYLDQGRKAQNQENYQNAIRFFEEAKKNYPEASEPSQMLGDLYRNRGLYRLALPEFQSVLTKKPGNSSAWLNVAETHGYLNEDQKSVEVFQTAVGLFPDDPDLIQALAWMYFKTEAFQKGITLLENYVKDRGTNRTVEMTLGTLYSSLYEYDLSRQHYLKSLEMADNGIFENSSFRSIAWYNLSLLEKSFYQYDRSLEAIKNSIQVLDRPSGSLALGELYQSRQDYAKARAAFEKSLEKDETPLSLYDLAKLNQEFGNLDEALAQTRQIENHKDESWIYNYGVTRLKFQKDVNLLYRDIYRAMEKKSDFDPKANPWDWLMFLLNKIRLICLGWYHDQVYKNLLVQLSQDSLKMKNSDEAWTNLTYANRDNPAVALKYLRFLSDEELPKNPLAKASILKEEGLIRRDPDLLKSALDRFQNPWQNEEAVEARQNLLNLQRGQLGAGVLRREISKLYSINPGALLQSGFSLPVEASVFGPDSTLNQSWQKELETLASQTGWDLAFADRENVTYSLSLQCGPGTAVRWTLRDAKGMAVRQGAGEPAADKRQAWLNALFQQLHRQK